VDIALFFGASALIIAFGWISDLLHLVPDRLMAAVASTLLMALPYLLLRLVHDFAAVPPLLMWGAAVGLAACAVGLFLGQPSTWPLWLILLYVAYFVGLVGYTTARFIEAARRAQGVTRRRMQLVAAGSFFLGLTIAIAGFQAAAPALAGLWMGLSRLSGLASGLAYFLGFAPPLWLRRAWQEPELRAFLGRAARLPRLPDTRQIVRELEQGAATALGAPAAVIGLWDPHADLLRSEYQGNAYAWPSDQLIGGRAFSHQRPIFTANAPREDPEHAEIYRAGQAIAVLAAPITAGPNRLGVLSVFAARAPIFAEDDLSLVQLLADQAAVILESRALIDEAARVQAREEATRLKDDFLSVAAHDLKTPLATLLLQARLLERRLRRIPAAGGEVERVEAHIAEIQRLRTFVLDLLDAARAEQGQLVGARQRANLGDLVRACQARRPRRERHYDLEIEDDVVGLYDMPRIEQVIDNLLDNAEKYSRAGGSVRVRLWREDETAHLTVTDDGIGVPADDLPHIFDRFQRGANVDDRRFAGLGLGLYLCRAIVEQHGGRIVASSPGLERGTTFHVTLPALPAHEGGIGNDASTEVSHRHASADPP
jgi:signal transduction histidine kinase